MKKLLFVLSLCLLPTVVKAEVDLIGPIQANLLSHVVTSSMFGFRSQDRQATKLALTDTIVELGSYEGSSLWNIGAGFYGSPNSVEGENQVANWIITTQFRIDPFIKKHVPIKESWVFIKSIQHGPSASFDLTNHKWILAYQCGLGFSLNPLQQ